MSEEFKPCPFCGQLPSPESLGEDGYYITCSNVDCESTDGLSPKAWNRRPIEDGLLSRLRAAEKVLRQAHDLLMDIANISYQDDLDADERKRDLTRIYEDAQEALRLLQVKRGGE